MSPVNAHVQASPYAVIACFAVLLQPVCLLPPRVAGVAVPAFLSFISPARIQAATRGFGLCRSVG